MADSDQTGRFTFPKWTNWVAPLLVIGALGGAPYLLVLVGFGASPVTLNANFLPDQPIPYSHQLHVTELGLDCRYCHTTVEKTSFAAIPPTATCMNCHHGVLNQSKNLEPLYASFRSGMPIEWNKVHDLADYSYFNHSAHVNKGVSCVSCHGRVDRMGAEGVFQKEPLSMGWCLKCHREPEINLRPLNQVTNLLWGLNLTEAEARQIRELGYSSDNVKVGGKLSRNDRTQLGRILKKKHGIKSARQLSDCSACHR